MKFKNIYSSILVGLCLALCTVSCKYDTDIANPEKYVKIYMPQAVGGPDIHTLAMTDTAQILIYGANYGGTGYPDQDIPVHFEVRDDLVGGYNAAHGTNYLPIPDDAYELEADDAIIPKGKLSTKALSLKIITVNKLEDRVKYLIPIHITTTGKDSSVNKSLATTYFIVEARYDLIHVSMTEGDRDSVLHSLNMADTAQSIYYTAQYASDVDVDTDISLTFGVNPDLVDSFNTKHGTDYPVMPTGSYELLTTSANILQGETVTEPLRLKVKTRGYLTRFVKYLLPVTITKASADLSSPGKKIVVDKSKETAWFLIQATAKGIVLTIMSYGKNSGDNNLQALADLVKQYDPDLLYIRQLDKNTTRSGPEDQPAKLSQLLGMPDYIFFKGLDYQGGEYGDGLFSKFPVNTSETKTYELYSSGAEQGTLGIIQVKIQDSLRLYFSGTHLNANYARKMDQTAELLGITKDYNDPFILAGAFNGRPNGSYDNMNELKSQFTFPTTGDEYDQYIMYKPGDDFQVLSYQTIESSVTKYDLFLLKIKWYYED